LKHPTTIKKLRVGDVADIRFGLYAQPGDSGALAYLQVRQFSESGLLTKAADEYIDLNDKTKQHLLQQGDVLFVAKGSRLFAWPYHDTGMPAVASSIFFVLQPDLKLVDPGYLAAMLNAPQSRAAFQQIGGGTNIFSIRKSELAAFEIPLPALQQQKQVAALTRLHQREIELAQQLIMQKQIFYTGIISKLIK
jgi:restriction endonuclease S subunit